MSLNTDTTMNVVPAGYGNCNNGMFSGDWGWLILLLLFGNGYGFGGFGGFGFPSMFGFPGMFGGGNCGGSPCATQADLAVGFNNSAVISKLNDIQMAQTQGFHGVDNAVCTLGYNIQQGINAVQSQNAQCCCETQRLIERGFADTNYNLATQACDTRNLIQNTTRDITDNANANTRAILDFLVQSKLADKDARIAALEGQVARAEQNGVLRAAIDASTAEIIRRTGNDCPTPAYWVQPPTPVQAPCSWTHGYNGGCGQNYGFAS